MSLNVSVKQSLSDFIRKFIDKITVEENHVKVTAKTGRLHNETWVLSIKANITKWGGGGGYVRFPVGRRVNNGKETFDILSSEIIREHEMLVRD